MLGIKVSVGKIAVHLRICARHGETNTGEHVVGRHPVDMVLVDFCANDDAVVILVVPPFALAGALLSDVLSPSRGVLVLWHVIEMHVRVYRACGPARQGHGSPATGGCVDGRESAACTHDVIGVAAEALGTRLGDTGNLERVPVLQAIRGLGGARAVVIKGGRRRNAVLSAGDLEVVVRRLRLGACLGLSDEVFSGLSVGVRRAQGVESDMCSFAAVVYVAAVGGCKVAVIPAG